MTGPTGPLAPLAPPTTNSSIVVGSEVSGSPTPVTVLLSDYVAKNYSGPHPELAEAFAEHVHYEVEMLDAVHHWLANDLSAMSLPVRPNIDARQFAVNLAIETFCLHARNLCDFLKDQNRGWRDYAKPSFAGVPFGGLDRETYNKLNDQVSHIRVDNRTADPAQKIKTTDCQRIFRILAQHLRGFGDTLKDDYKHLWRCEFADDCSRITVRPP